MSSKTPAEPPPSYGEATGSNHATASSSSNQAGPSGQSHLSVPGSVPASKNGISPQHRRSMEDQARPLPEGWVRTFDPESSHQFFVDTTKDPPRSIWVHPYDDPEYLSTLSSEERERLEEQHSKPTRADIISEHTDEEDDHDGSHAGANDPELPPRPTKGKDDRSFGRKLKDKVTGTTHEEREKERARRAEEERRLYEQHMRIRECMAKAAQTGQPQLLGKDKNGKDVYVDPPRPDPYYGGGLYGYGNGYGCSPYGNGIYTTPNANYIRPSVPYNRGYGRGYGGGYGMPLALGGGLLGGLLLTDLLF